MPKYQITVVNKRTIELDARSCNDAMNKAQLVEWDQWNEGEYEYLDPVKLGHMAGARRRAVVGSGQA